MVAPRLPKVLGLGLAGVLLVAAVSFVSAQEGLRSTASPAAPAAEESASPALADASAAVAATADEGVKVDVAMTDQETIPAQVVAQATPPVAPTTEGAAQPALVSERAWQDGHKTIVECTGEAARTCQVNLYGPDGTFILGRKIMPSGEATDCNGPCLDSTGAPLDAASLARTQAAIASGSKTHKVIVSAGTPLPPVVEETPAETAADRLNHESD